MTSATPSATSGAPIRLAVDAADVGVPLDHFWSRAVGAGRAAEGLRADWQGHLADVVESCGFRYLRFHGLFHDDMFVYELDESGHATFWFGYVDTVFDALLDRGIRPFVEFGFSPRDLARETETVFWWGGHGSPPTDLAAWSELIEQTLRHWIDRYGLHEVRAWYFEVWNEPNLYPFFRGTRSEYFAVYAATVRAVKAVDPALRVGGPATSNFVGDTRFAGETENVHDHVTGSPELLASLDWQPVWLAEFLDFCTEQQLPVDFVSCHPYPTDWALDEHGQGRKQTRGRDATIHDLGLLRRIIDASPYPGAEIHLTEWSSSSSSRDHTHDQLPAATFVLHTVLSSIGLVDSLAYWTFTDVFEEQGIGRELFHGGFGLITQPGIVKPTYHAYRLLHRLGDRLLQQTPGGVVTTTPDRLSALAYHYPDEVTLAVPASFDSRRTADDTATTGARRTVHVELSGLEPAAEVSVEWLTATAGNAIAAWRAAGEPTAPDREQLARLRAEARDTTVTSLAADRHGRLVADLDLAAWSCVLIEARLAPDRPSAPRGGDTPRGADTEQSGR